jgi:hypothetical protein
MRTGEEIGVFWLIGEEGAEQRRATNNRKDRGNKLHTSSILPTN